MLLKSTRALLGALALTAAAAQAQNAAPAAKPASQAAAPSAAKKALIDRVLQLQQPGIEGVARQLVEQPAMQMLQTAGQLLQRLPADKREQLAREMQADARRYADDTTPLVRKRAVELAPQTIGVVLNERFNDDELKQLISILESPVNRKFQLAAGDMQRALFEKLVPDVRGTVEPRVKALDQAMSQRLQAAASAAAGSASAPK